MSTVGRVNWVRRFPGPGV